MSASVDPLPRPDPIFPELELSDTAAFSYHRQMTLRAAATSLFGVIVFIVLAIASGLISANVRKLADRRGWDRVPVSTL